MFSGYKDAPSYYNNQSIFENHNQGSFLPADTSKQTSAPPWDYTQQSFNAVPCYTGDQNLNHRHSGVIHNQVVSQFDNNNVLAHYKNISSGNNHQSVVRPRAVINCQSNCNACYNHSVGRIPSHWNPPPTESVHYVPGNSTTLPPDDISRFAPNLASFPQHEDASHHITSGFATQLNKLSRFSKDTVSTAAPKKDVLSSTEDCSVLRNNLPRAEPSPSDSATVKKDTCVTCRGVCNRATCKIYQHQSIKFSGLEPIALQQYGVPRENVVRYTGHSNGNSNCNQWSPVGTHQPPGLWLQNSRPPSFWMPSTENIRNVGNTGITNFWDDSGCDTPNQQLPPTTSYHEVNTDKSVVPTRNQSQKETQEEDKGHLQYQEPPRYTELLVRRKVPDEMRYQPQSTLADCGIPQETQYRNQVEVQSNKDLPSDSSNVSESTRSHANLNGVNPALPNFSPSDLSNQSRNFASYHKPKVPPSSSSSNFSTVLGIAQPPSRFSSDPTYTQSKISRSNNYMRLFPEHTIEDTYNLSSDIVGNSFSSFSRSGTTNRHLPYHSIKHPPAPRNAESIIRFGGESSTNITATHLQPCGRMPSDNAQYQGVSNMQVVENNPSCSMGVPTFINSPPNRRETGYQNVMSGGGDCNIYYNRQTLHPSSYDDENYNIHSKIGVISRSSKETCHLTPPSMYMSVDKPQLLPLLDETGVNRPIKKRKPRTKMRSEQERWHPDKNGQEMSAPVLDVRHFLATWDEETDDLSPSPGGQKLPDVVLSNSSAENPLLVLDCRTINTGGVATLSTVDRNSLSDGNGSENVIHMYQHEISPSSCNSVNNDTVRSDINPVMIDDLPAQSLGDCPSLIPIEPGNVDTCIKPLPAGNLMERFQEQENTNSGSIEDHSIKSTYKSPENISDVSRNTADPPLQNCQSSQENDKDRTLSKPEISEHQECRNLPDNLHLEASPCLEDNVSSGRKTDDKNHEFPSSENCSTDKNNFNFDLNNTIREMPLLTDTIISVPTLKSLCTDLLKKNNQMQSSNVIEKSLSTSKCSKDVEVKLKLDSDIDLFTKDISENPFEISCDRFKNLDLPEEKEDNLLVPVSDKEDTAARTENNRILPFKCDNSIENESSKLNREVNKLCKNNNFDISPKEIENEEEEEEATNLDRKLVTEPSSPSIKDCVQELIKNIDEVSENHEVKTDNFNNSELLEISDSFELQEIENTCVNNNSDTSRSHKEESSYINYVGDVGEDLDMSVTSSISSTPGSIENVESEDEMLNIKLKVSDSEDESRVDIPVNTRYSDGNEPTLSPVAVMLKESTDISSDLQSKQLSDDYEKFSNSGDIFANLIEENTKCNDKSELVNCQDKMSVSKTMCKNDSTLSPCISEVYSTTSAEVSEDEAHNPDQISSNTISQNGNKMDKGKSDNNVHVNELDEILLGIESKSVNPLENLQEIVQCNENTCVQPDPVLEVSSSTINMEECEENSCIQSDPELPNSTIHTTECQFDPVLEITSNIKQVTDCKEKSSLQPNSTSDLSSKVLNTSESVSITTDTQTSIVQDTSNVQESGTLSSDNCDNICSGKLPKLKLEVSKNKILSAEMVPNSESNEHENLVGSDNVDHKITNLEHSKDIINEVCEHATSLILVYDVEKTKSCEDKDSDCEVDSEQFDDENLSHANPEIVSEDKNCDALDLAVTSSTSNVCKREGSKLLKESSKRIEIKNIPCESGKIVETQIISDTENLERKETSRSPQSTISCNQEEKAPIKNIPSDFTNESDKSDLNVFKTYSENLDVQILKQTVAEQCENKVEDSEKNEGHEFSVNIVELSDENSLHDCGSSNVFNISPNVEPYLADHNKDSTELVVSTHGCNEENRNESILKEQNVLQEVVGTDLTDFNTNIEVNNSLETQNISLQEELLYDSVSEDQDITHDSKEQCSEIDDTVTEFTDNTVMSTEKISKEKDLQSKDCIKSSFEKKSESESCSLVQTVTYKSLDDDTSLELDTILENSEDFYSSQSVSLSSNENINSGPSENDNLKQACSEDEQNAQEILETTKENKTISVDDNTSVAENKLGINEIGHMEDNPKSSESKLTDLSCSKSSEFLIPDLSSESELDKFASNTKNFRESKNILEDNKFNKTFSKYIEPLHCVTSSSLETETHEPLRSDFPTSEQDCSKEETNLGKNLESVESITSKGTETCLNATAVSPKAESIILNRLALEDRESVEKSAEHIVKSTFEINCTVIERKNDADSDIVISEDEISEKMEAKGRKVEKEENDKEVTKEDQPVYYDSVTVPSRIFEIDEELDYDYDDVEEEDEDEDDGGGDEEEDDNDIDKEVEEEKEKQDKNREVEQEEKEKQVQEEEEKENDNPQQTEDVMMQEEHQLSHKSVVSETLREKEVISKEDMSVVHCYKEIWKEKEVSRNSGIREVENQNDEDKEKDDYDDGRDHEEQQRTQIFSSLIEPFHSEAADVSSGIGKKNKETIRDRVEETEYKSAREDSKIVNPLQSKVTDKSSETVENGMVDDCIEYNEKQKQCKSPSEDLSVVKSLQTEVNTESSVALSKEEDFDKEESRELLSSSEYTRNIVHSLAKVADPTSDSTKNVTGEEVEENREEKVEKENDCNIITCKNINPVQSKEVVVSSGVSEEQEKNDHCRSNWEEEMEKEKVDEKDYDQRQKIQTYSEANTVLESTFHLPTTQILFSQPQEIEIDRIEISDKASMKDTENTSNSSNLCSNHECMITNLSHNSLCSSEITEIKSRNIISIEPSFLCKNNNLINEFENNNITSLQELGKNTDGLSQSSNEIQVYRKNSKPLEGKLLEIEALEDNVHSNSNSQEVTKDNLVLSVSTNSLVQNDNVLHVSKNSSCNSVDKASEVTDLHVSKVYSSDQEIEGCKLMEGEDEVGTKRIVEICNINDKEISNTIVMEEGGVSVTIKMDKIGETQNEDVAKTVNLEVGASDSPCLEDEDTLEYPGISNSNDKDEIENEKCERPCETVQNIEHDLNYNSLTHERLNHNRKLTDSVDAENAANNKEIISYTPNGNNTMQCELNHLDRKCDINKTDFKMSSLEEHEDLPCSESDHESCHSVDMSNKKSSSKDIEKQCNEICADGTIINKISTPTVISEYNLQCHECERDVENCKGDGNISSLSEEHFLVESNVKCLEKNHVKCLSPEGEDKTEKGTSGIQRDICKSYHSKVLNEKSVNFKEQTSLDMDDMPELEIIDTEISPDDSDSLEMPCLELITDTVKIRENDSEKDPEINPPIMETLPCPQTVTKNEEKKSDEVERGSEDANSVTILKNATVNTIKDLDRKLLCEEENYCSKYNVSKPETPVMLSDIEDVDVRLQLERSEYPSNESSKQHKADENTQEVLQIESEITKEKPTLENSKDLIAEDLQDDADEHMECVLTEENKTKRNLQDLPVSPNSLQILSSYLGSDTTTVDVVEVSADELQKEWESLQITSSDLECLSTTGDRTEGLNVLISTVENSDSPPSLENAISSTELVDKDATPVCLLDSEVSCSEENENSDPLTVEVVPCDSMITESNSNLEDIIPAESVSNWLYLEEEVFSDIPITTNSVDIPCAASSVVSPQSPTSEEPSPSPAPSNGSTSISPEINSTQSDLGLALNGLKCSLSWKRIFNLSKANCKKQQQSNNIQNDSFIDKTCTDRNNDVISMEPDTSNDTVLDEEIINTSEMLSGIVKNKQQKYGFRKKQIELGLAKIEVRLTPTPPPKNAGLQKKWEVVDGPKTEVQKKFTDDISTNEADLSLATINPVPIVLVKRLVLKRRSSDESEIDSEIKRPNIFSPSLESSKSVHTSNNPDNIESIHSITEINSSFENVNNDSKVQNSCSDSSESSESEKDTSSVTSVSTPSSRNSSRSGSKSRSRSRSESQSSSCSRSKSRSRSRSKSQSSSNSGSKSRSRSRSKSQSSSSSTIESKSSARSHSRSRTRSPSVVQNRTRSDSITRSINIIDSRSRSRSGSRTRSDSREKSRTRSNSRERNSETLNSSRSRSRTRSTSKSKSNRGESITRSSSRTRSETSISRTRSASRSSSRTRSRSNSETRSRSSSSKIRTRKSSSSSREKNKSRSNNRMTRRTRSRSRRRRIKNINIKESRSRSKTRSGSRGSNKMDGIIEKMERRTRSNSRSSQRRSRSRTSSSNRMESRTSSNSSRLESIMRNSTLKSRTRSNSRSSTGTRDSSRMRSRSRSGSSNRIHIRTRSNSSLDSRTGSNSTRSSTRNSSVVGNRSRSSSGMERIKDNNDPEMRSVSNSKIGIRTRSSSRTMSRNNSCDSTKSKISDTDLCGIESENNKTNITNSHPVPTKINIEEDLDSNVVCNCVLHCKCPKVIDDINLSEDRLLPRVIIKRTSGLGNTKNYRSFLRSASFTSTDNHWQPFVRLERSSSLDELAKKISTRNGSYKDGLRHGLKITLKSPTCQPRVQLIPLPFNRIRRHSESESEASRKQRRRKYFSRINTHHNGVNSWRTRRRRKFVHTSDSVSVSSDTNDTEPNSEPSLSIKLTAFNNFTKVQNETIHTDKNKPHNVTDLKNDNVIAHKTLDENEEYRVVGNKNYTKDSATKITFQRHKKKEEVLSKNVPKIINIKIKEYKQNSVQNQNSHQDVHEDETIQNEESSPKENAVKITFQHHKKKEEVLNGNEPKIINLKIKEYKQDPVENESNHLTLLEDETTQKVESFNKENATKITIQRHKKKEEILNGNESKINIKIKENKQDPVHNETDQQTISKEETPQEFASSVSETNKRLSSELDHSDSEELHSKKKQHLSEIDENEVLQPSLQKVTEDIPASKQDCSIPQAINNLSDTPDSSRISKKRSIDDTCQKNDELPFFQPDRILSISSVKKKRTCIDKVNSELVSEDMQKDKCELFNETEINEKRNVCDEICLNTAEKIYAKGEKSNKDQPSESVETSTSESQVVSESDDRVCQACGHVYEDQNERAVHVRQHPYHCRRCHLGFQSESDFVGHLSEQHPRTRERHHCLLCEKSFPTADRHRLHLAGRTHRHLELTQRRTIHTLYSVFTGRNCPVLPPLTEAERAGLNWFPVEPGTIHFYHQATPLQRALQDLNMKKKGDCLNSTPVTSRLSTEDNVSTS